MKSVITTACLILICLSTILLFSFKCGHNSQPIKKTVIIKPSFAAFITERQFNTLFPQRNKFYTYPAFIKAVNELSNIQVKVIRRGVSVYQLIRTDKSIGKTNVVRQDPDWNEAWAKVKPDSAYLIDYGLFCTEKDVETNKKELAAFFAQIAHETRHGENGTYTDGLMEVHEASTTQSYVSESDEYPPVKGQKYYGRGPMQISYNGNYGYAGDCIFGHAKLLLNNPSLIETDAVVSFKTAIYFWMTPQTHKPSAHDVMIGKWQPAAIDKAKGRVPGFGMTINIVNGEVECNKGDSLYNMNDRIGFYQYFLKKMGLTDSNCACGCGKMEPYK